MKKTTLRKPETTEKSKKERLLSKDYILVILSILGVNMLNNFFLATIAPYMNILTGKVVYGGVMISVYAATAMLVRPASGILSDKFGRVKQIALGAFVCAASCLCFGFTKSLPLLIILRITGGIGFGMNSTCVGAAVADVVPRSRLSEGIGYYGLYSSVGQMVAPAIALSIVSGGGLNDYRNMFFTAAIICAASGVTGACISYERKLKKSGVPEPRKDTPEHAHVKSADSGTRPAKVFFGFEQVVFAPCLVILLFMSGFTGVLSYITAFAEKSGLGGAGFFFTASAVGMLISRLFLGKAVDRFGPDAIVIPSLAVMTACLALIPELPSAAALVILALPIGISQGAVYTTMNSIIFIRCSPAHRGTASGAFFAAMDIGYAAGAPFLGAVVDASGFTVMYRITAVFVLLAFAAYMLFASDRKYHKKYTEAGSV
ncbi:MAG: MFS transporter [Oscillospiraceae bacterium]|nr:MFS transporter [Oscillospiraceae bacterium]